jgi:hypothetical protein
MSQESATIRHFMIQWDSGEHDVPARVAKFLGWHSCQQPLRLLVGDENPGSRALDTRERGSYCKTQTTKENATICYFVIQWINKRRASARHYSLFWGSGGSTNGQFLFQ